MDVIGGGDNDGGSNRWPDTCDVAVENDFNILERQCCCTKIEEYNSQGNRGKRNHQVRDDPKYGISEVRVGRRGFVH